MMSGYTRTIILDVTPVVAQNSRTIGLYVLSNICAQ